MAFMDHAKILLVSGKGGDGHVSFRREKYVAAGGPDGGDGGNGGSVIFVVDDGLHTLSSFRHKYKFAAENGENGGKRRCHGKDGKDLILAVPEGTVLLEASTGRVIADLSGDCRRAVVLSGGKGGKGNMHFATPTQQVPRYAQPGGASRQVEVRLELKLIADIALVGFPNAGKSTFLSRISRARPKIADYPFTTLTPQLGVVEQEDGAGFVVADIPGLIAGASEGAGLGHAFLRHIERTKILLLLVDISGSEDRDPVEDLETLRRELRQYRTALGDRTQVVAANKIDLLPGIEDGQRNLDRLQSACEALEIPFFPISAATGEGISTLLHTLRQMLDALPQETETFASEWDPDSLAQEHDLPYTVVYDEKEKCYVAEGPRIERLLDYTNLETEKGFRYFQSFLKEQGIIDTLRDVGLQEGDTVRMYGWQFIYYQDEEDDDE